MNWYVNTVTTHPIITAMIQFAILGTLGEFISKWIVSKKFHMPFSIGFVLWKMVVWAILAFFIKMAFTGMEGFLDSAVDHHLMFPAVKEPGFLRAFMKSVTTNLFFGFFLIIGHRFLDNIVLKEKSYKGIDIGIKSLIWFWIPAHTITFILPKAFQIGLAALWSVALGIILGFAIAVSNKK